MVHWQEKLAETAPEEAETSFLLDEDFKSTVLNILTELKETMNKEQKETMTTMYKKWRRSLKR